MSIMQNSRMRDESDIKQCLELRGKDNDMNSLCDDLQPRSEPALRKRKGGSITEAVGNNESKNTRRKRKKEETSPGTSRQDKVGKAEKGKRRSKKGNVAQVEIERGRRKEVETEKSTPCTCGHTGINDLKSYMSSLLEDLNTARENLLVWMKDEVRKMVVEEIASESEKIVANLAGSKVQVQHVKSADVEDSKQVPRQQNIVENKQVPQHECHLKEHSQVQHLGKVKENGHKMNRGNFQDNNNKVHPLRNFKEDFLLCQKNPFRSCMITQNCNTGSSGKIGGSNKSNKTVIDCNTKIEDQTEYRQAIVPVTPTENDILNSKSSPSDQTVQAEQQKSVVLGIRAQNCAPGYSARSGKGKRIADPFDNCQVLDDQVKFGHVIGSMASAEKNKGDGFGYFLEPKSTYCSSNHAGSSMFLTFPNILTKHYSANNELGASSFSAIRAGINRNQTVTNSERSNSILNSNMAHRFIQNIQPQERTGNHTQTMSSRENSYFSENIRTNPTSGAGYPMALNRAINGSFAIPSQINLENLLQENKTAFGVWMDGGAMSFPGGGYSL